MVGVVPVPPVPAPSGDHANGLDRRTGAASHHRPPRRPRARVRRPHPDQSPIPLADEQLDKIKDKKDKILSTLFMFKVSELLKGENGPVLHVCPPGGRGVVGWGYTYSMHAHPPPPTPILCRVCESYVF